MDTKTGNRRVEVEPFSVRTCDSTIYYHSLKKE